MYSFKVRGHGWGVCTLVNGLLMSVSFALRIKALCTHVPGLVWESKRLLFIPLSSFQSHFWSSQNFLLYSVPLCFDKIVLLFVKNVPNWQYPNQMQGQTFSCQLLQQLV